MIQTGSEGMAKIVFNDGTNYTVKQDSLIVIEENSAERSPADQCSGEREYRNRELGDRNLHAGLKVDKSWWTVRRPRWRQRARPGSEKTPKPTRRNVDHEG